MWILLLLLLLATASRAQVPMTIGDYHGGPMEGEAWITLTTPSVDWTLQRLVWCKSLVPNDQHPDPLPHNCVGRNLLRIQLYPDHPEAVTTEPPAPTDKYNTYYIDPQQVGGWDSRHQWIMEMELQRRVPGKTPSSMIQVTRFNPVDALVNVPGSSSSSDSDSTSSSSSSSSITSTATVMTSTTTTDDSILAAQPWIGFVIILGVGFLLIGVALMAYRFWPRRKFTSKYAPTLYYDWSKRETVDELDEEARLREEDLQILSKMNN